MKVGAVVRTVHDPYPVAIGIIETISPSGRYVQVRKYFGIKRSSMKTYHIAEVEEVRIKD